MRTPRSRSLFATARRTLPAVALLAVLAACGGGGGGTTRVDPPPAGPPPTPPPTPPVVEAPNPAFSNHLAWTGADQAHAAGLTGAGVRIGFLDSGVNRNHPALAGRVVANLNYINPNTNNLTVDDVSGHGTAVAQIAAGRPFGQWPGGIAPGAEIVSARIISDRPPSDDGSGQGNQLNGPLGVASIHQDLMNRNVRIMNNSWGGLYWTNANVTAQVAAEYRPFIVNHGGLVVFSAGNSGFANPSDTAALPSQPGPNGTTPAADLERGWLAVAALDGTDSRQLASYSNACGVAMHYCLAAPGTVITTGTNNAPNAPEYFQWRGTSFSAPIVSGAAALVWEAFPYFTNDNVRQTLLGTATDIGAPGVDPVFGHGALNIAAAVRGPSRLEWGDFVANFNGITSTWGNVLRGDGTLVKRGTGTLVLDAMTQNTGGIRVEGGTVEANNIVQGNATIAAAGTLRTGQALVGNVDNAGRLDVRALNSNPAAPQATFTYGNYHQRSGGTLSMLVGHYLAATGTVTLDGGTLHINGVKPGYVSQARETVLRGQGGLTGQFSQLTWANNLFLQATLGYDATDAWLDITRLDVAAAAKAMAAATPASISSAQRVEEVFRSIDAGRAGADGMRHLAGEFQSIGDERQAIAALDSLSGESHALATTLTFDAIDMGRRALSSRFDAFDARADGAQVWKRALGRGGDTGIGGGDFALDGWLVGRDQKLGANAVAGFAFGETRADDRVGGNRDRSRDRQAHGQFYGGRLFDGGYAMAQFGFGRFDRSIERSLFDGDGRRGVSSRYSGDYVTLGLEGGRQHRFGDALLTGYVGSDYTQLDSDGFRELGDSGFALHAGAARMSRLQAIAGVRAERDWRGATWRAYGEWQQVLDASGFDVPASFVGIDSWSPLPLADAARSGGLFGVGFGTRVSRNAALSFGFDQRFGPRGDERMASFRYAYGF
ncbi:autotransporter domain-containing protein [Luteimonas aestuarii]|uniref:Autotransporter domain-containing protein n=1 Tax=Luteimonas aestuarii TaxID=453837 RepID=A0A4R5TT19_9GAMM|nr:autotransporter serine protease [Luteimonas aestuarii]TDK22327.1 autotransporter domain-containing protein [Luteimonas aestuarii]